MNRHFQISRRSFMTRCAALAAAGGLPLWFVERELAAQEAPKSPRSPNDRPGIALIGCGGMGRGDAQNASRFGDIVAVCDVDDNHASEAAKQFTKNGRTPARFSDFRRALERGDVDIAVQATPDHWHTLVNLAATRAKKDVYGEKPMTLTIDEGKHLIKAVREHRTVFQTGTQQRSDKKFRLACELVRNGRIGKLKQVQVFVPAGLREGPFKTVPVPPGLNWDFWQGQTPGVDYLKERCHANFRWWWEYSGGPVTDWGAHHNDIACWGIGQDGPTGVEARALTEPIPGGYTTPSEFEATLTWANGVTQSVRTTPDDTPYGGVIRKDGQRNGVKFVGTDGWIWVNRADLGASKDDILETPLPANAVRLEVSNDHMGNFFDCVRTRKTPVAPVEVGHRSAAIGHLIVIALRTGRKYQWDPAREEFIGENAQEGNAHLARPMRPPYNWGFVS
ncbi:MAG TPA: Gfo/Idh/MocA family oxidoreductase [Verrucomicrobiota bacterium]|nr:Gfo/Idh/MocA family oxidoreductase [Verrucomicrobiota bacterium]HNT16166.1 Gfo/Idh/MocA family oxidoreductase [Verrucomicrobiota bacterium]